MAPHFDPDAARALMQQGEQRALSNRGPAAEVLATGNYVYIRVERAEDQVWLAAPRQEVPLGSEVRWGDGVEMHDFKSHQLDRFFHKVVFVDRIAVGPPK